MGKLFEAIGNIFRIPDLRKRVAVHVRTAGRLPSGQFRSDARHRRHPLDRTSSPAQQGSIFGFFDLFAGGNIRRLSIFALGIMPYITASIILQLLTVVVPTLEKLQKEGELGRRKITQWTRYLTVVPRYCAVVRHRDRAAGHAGQHRASIPAFGFILLTILSLTTGTAFIMWLGEQITERGVGNGMSLIIFTGIVVGLPAAIGNIYTNVFVTHEWSFAHAARDPGHDGRGGRVHRAGGNGGAPDSGAVCQARDRTPRDGRAIDAHAAEGERGRRDSGDLRFFDSGVPADDPATLPFVKNNAWLSSMLGSIRHGEPLYVLLFVALIIFFCFFYVSIIFNPNEAADNMRKYGGFIPGIRPGRSTSDYMNTILTRITFVGAIYLSILCLIPGHHDLRHPSAASAADRQLHRCALSRASFWKGLNVSSTSAALRC